MENFDVRKFDLVKFDSILSRGLCLGVGIQGQRVCIEAAICETLGLPHGDDPGCVSAAVRSFKIALNDCNWSSPAARAKGLRELGIAQLGSEGVVDDSDFARRISEKTIRVLIPKIFRVVFANNLVCLEAADRCEKEGTSAAYNAASAAYYAAVAANYAASAANYAAANAAANAAYYAASAASYAANAASAANYAASAANYAAANASDEYLTISAGLALEVLRELKSPGVELL